MVFPRHTPAHTDTDEVAALAAIYTADRTDHTVSINNSIALLAAGVGYATATLAFFDRITEAVAPLVLTLLPLPMWMVALYHTLLTSASMSRSVSIRTVESALLAKTTIPTQAASHIGHSAVEQTLNLFHARWPHKIASMVAYGGVGFVAAAYTGYVLSQDVRLPCAGIVAGAGGYLFLAALLVWCWITAFARYHANVRTGATYRLAPEP